MRVHQWPWQSRNVSKLSWNPFWRREESVWAAQLRDNSAKYPGTSRGQLEVRVHTRPSRGRIRWANCHQGQDKTNGKGIQISMMDLLPLWRNETKFVLNISRPPSYTTFQYCHQKQIVLCLSTLSQKGVSKISAAVKLFFKGLSLCRSLLMVTGHEWRSHEWPVTISSDPLSDKPEKNSFNASEIFALRVTQCRQAMNFF